MTEHSPQEYQYQPGPVRRWIDAQIDRHVESRMDKMVAQYATKKDGSVDEGLATRIEWEMRRRWTQGKQLDIIEPLRWAGISTAASVGLGIGAAFAKAAFEKTAPPAWKGLAFVSAVTAIGSLVQLARIVPRYDQGLRGAAETARAQYLQGQQNMSSIIASDTGGKAVGAAQSGKDWGASVGTANERNAQTGERSPG